MRQYALDDGARARRGHLRLSAAKRGKQRHSATRQGPTHSTLTDLIRLGQGEGSCNDGAFAISQADRDLLPVCEEPRISSEGPVRPRRNTKQFTHQSTHRTKQKPILLIHIHEVRASR